MMPEITVLIYTARNDYPYVEKAAGWHCFDPVLRTLADQTFKDFELLIVDAHWEKRSDWFATRPQPFPVKHVPSSPNYWHDRGSPGLSAQLNRGFAWADGKYVWMGGENNLFPSHHLALAAELFRSGKLPSAWYAISDRVDGAFVSESEGPLPNVQYSIHGFTRTDVKSVDHRAARFVNDPSLVLSPCHENNFFGYSGLPIDAAIAVNGFDELMDGCMSLQDCDFGCRLGARGYQMVMHRDLYVVEPPTKPLPNVDGWGGGIGHKVRFQCNYAILLHNKLSGRRVNTALPPGYAEDVQKRICLEGGACSVRAKCVGGQISESEQYPFCGGKLETMAREWHAAAPVRDLATERELRKQRVAPYDRAFISE
jgi:hypothetical protein